MKDHLEEYEYKSQFDDGKVINQSRDLSRHWAALERAWKNRDFEIELYWKRATYFWGFIAAAFTGYFLVVRTMEKGEEYYQVEFAIICLGFMFSLAWSLVNHGSKKWQENWEKHIDMLEDDKTGPLYKTVLRQPAYSVSGVNQKISLFVVIVWCILAVAYKFRNKLEWFGTGELDWITSSLLFTTSLGAFLLIRDIKGFVWVSNRKWVRVLLALLLFRWKDLSSKEQIPKISFAKREFEYDNPQDLKG